MNAEDIRILMQDFSKPEIQSIVDELGLEDPPTVAKAMIAAVVKDIEMNGLPVTTGKSKCSKLLRDFLIAAEFIDQKDNPIYHAQPEEVKVSSEPQKSILDVKPKQQDANIQKPPCFGFEDDNDPSCRKCKVKAECYNLRVASRPECFGKLYSVHAPECQSCYEAPYCKLALQNQS